MAIQVGRRIIWDGSTGKVICDLGQMQGDVILRETIGELKVLELEYDAYADEFNRAIRWHIDPVTEQPVFDELTTVQPTYEELQTMIKMLTEGVI